MRRGAARLLRQHGTGRPALDNPWFALASGRVLPFGMASRKGVDRESTHGYVQDSKPAPMAAALAQEDLALPVLATDSYGATSVVRERDQAALPHVYENIDGKRLDDGRYKEFAAQISGFIPKGRQFTDPVRTFAYGTDASFYRLIPRMVIKVHNEDEVQRILQIANSMQVPVTFRAAGTSLAGQAITDSVLLKVNHVGKNFRGYKVHNDGSAISVEPGLIGSEVNKILAAFQQKGRHPIQYKMGPDPASIDSAMVGGILANNASGMCCGVSQNTYNTIKDLRIVFADGTVLDTADPASRAAFLESHADMVARLQDIVRRVQGDEELSALIRRKFAIKCTTGYALNSLVDFGVDDPIEVIKHLMVGSEGTLAFVSEATYNTVPEWPNKASCLLIFPTIEASCTAAAVLRHETEVNAVEFFDRNCLEEWRKDTRLVKLCPDIKDLGDQSTALLIECRSQTPEGLEAVISQVQSALVKAEIPLGSVPGHPHSIDNFPFEFDPKRYQVYWDARKGIFPLVGGAREDGTSVLLEDVACPVERLAAMTSDIIELVDRLGYGKAYIFGHALEGNIHLVVSQGFRTPEEVQKFADLMRELCDIVANKHGGSLKGEHGTGRNMAPFVEMEWGTKATGIMWELKQLFDPRDILNPGVVLNKDPLSHIKNLKPSPPIDPLVNRCIECGFCESNCPSRDLTISPRQRIVVAKEIFRLENLEGITEAQKERLEEMRQIYEYDGKDTCAADGMCKEKCPVKINTGDLIKSLRAHEMQDVHPSYNKMAQYVARHFEGTAWVMKQVLSIANIAHAVLGPTFLEQISGLLNKASGHLVPTWTKYMPKESAPVNYSPEMPPVPLADNGIPRKVVYLPTCVTRIMGPARGDDQQESVHQKLMSIFQKGGYEVIIPEGTAATCCGMMFDTRGFKQVAAGKRDELEAILVEASENGKYPIVMDTSPCAQTVKVNLSSDCLRFALYEPVEFISTFLANKLEWTKVRDQVAIHVPCSSKQMGISSHFAKASSAVVASLCSHEVVDSNIPCCGQAGDRGMRFPELPQASLQHIKTNGCSDGYSTSRTCEVALSNAAGFDFRGLVYLVDEATKRKPVTQ